MLSHRDQYHRHELLKRQDSLQRQHHLLLQKLSELEEALIPETDPLSKFKLRQEIQKTREQLVPVELQLEKVLRELDRLIPLAPSAAAQPEPASRGVEPPIRQSRQTLPRSRSAIPKKPVVVPTRPYPRHQTAPVMSETVFVVVMAAIWLMVGWSSQSWLGQAHADQVVLGNLSERDLVPGIPGAIAGGISGFCSTLLRPSPLSSTTPQSPLLSIILGSVSGFIVWAVVWRSVSRVLAGTAIPPAVVGAFLGLLLGVVGVSLFDRRRTGR
ncbi:MAG: hypothetical protein MUF49_22800 [Oculatellaceae cyanobacterium Prado106]|jgi:hypothetical protein|nr:hypothetical protein [Oculatellaceae cyanobacterium Prado106]